MTIIGHTTNQQHLNHAHQAGRLSHALLFSGLNGIGKYTLALDFAKALLCKQAIIENSILKSCGTCNSCLKIEHHNHPDLVKVMSPAEETRQGIQSDKKSVSEKINIERIRNIEKLVHRPPYEGQFRVILIKNAENMNTQAANALLKSLEEPHQNNLIILTSSKPKQLLPTILSRVLHLRFNPLSRVELRTLLVEKNVEEIDARMQDDVLTYKECIDYSTETEANNAQVVANQVNEALENKNSFAILESIESIGKDRLFAASVLQLTFKLMHKKLMTDIQENIIPLPARLIFMENLQKALSQIHFFNVNVTIFLEELLLLKS